jgi:hypothetical protein
MCQTTRCGWWDSNPQALRHRILSPRYRFSHQVLRNTKSNTRTALASAVRNAIARIVRVFAYGRGDIRGTVAPLFLLGAFVVLAACRDTTEPAPAEWQRGPGCTVVERHRIADSAYGLAVHHFDDCLSIAWDSVATTQ